MSADREPSASSNPLPDLELQGDTYVRTADHLRRIHTLRSADGEGKALTTQHGGREGISLQEEIQNVVRERYIQFYQNLSEWLGQQPSRAEVIRQLELEVPEKKDIGTQVGSMVWNLELKTQRNEVHIEPEI